MRPPNNPRRARLPTAQGSDQVQGLHTRSGIRPRSGRHRAGPDSVFVQSQPTLLKTERSLEPLANHSKIATRRVRSRSPRGRDRVACQSSTTARWSPSRSSSDTPRVYKSHRAKKLLSRGALDPRPRAMRRRASWAATAVVAEVIGKIRPNETTRARILSRIDRQGTYWDAAVLFQATR